MYQYNDLADKRVLVRGASGDIGTAICEAFLQQQSHFMRFISRAKLNCRSLKRNIFTVTD